MAKVRWRFDDDRDGFTYDDDAFRFRDRDDADGARGGRDEDGGLRKSGALAVTLGGAEGSGLTSGGWVKEFTLDEAAEATLVFRVKVNQTPHYRERESTDVRVALDGEFVEIDGRNHAVRLHGDGPGGDAHRTGWLRVEVDLGRLRAGEHEIALGGFGDVAGSGRASTKILFDDVRLEAEPAKAPKLGRFEAEVIRLTNDFREDHGLDPVEADVNLVQAAENWSRQMGRKDFYRHSEVDEQMRRFGYEADGYGENIAAGQRSARQVVEAWIDSPGHRANMLREDFEHIGVGHHRESDDGGRVAFTHYWTQIFANADGDYLL
jgi:hypothetical protein